MLTANSSSPTWPVSTFTKAFEDDKRIDSLCKIFVSSEEETAIVDAQKDALWDRNDTSKTEARQLWLERFGGPGIKMEKVTGDGVVVLRDMEDEKGFLRVLI
jgi:hypothetical protein